VFSAAISRLLQVAESELPMTRCIQALDASLLMLRLSGANTLSHAASIQRGWDGRALCGARPGGTAMWDVVDPPVLSCPACLRRLRTRVPRK
jgi:hypothetical protein